MKPIGNVVLIAATFFTIFGILGVQVGVDWNSFPFSSKNIPYLVCVYFLSFQKGIKYLKKKTFIKSDVTWDDFKRNIVARKIDICNMTINLLQQRCKNLKSVQSCATRCAPNVALRIVCSRHVTRIDFLCNNIALKSSRVTSYLNYRLNYFHPTFQLFKGMFYSCKEVLPYVEIQNKSQCLSNSGKWMNDEYNFDNLPRVCILLCFLSWFRTLKQNKKNYNLLFKIMLLILYALYMVFPKHIHSSHRHC